MKNNFNSELLGIIQHFYKESSFYGGHPIGFDEDLEFIITSEFPYLEIADTGRDYPVLIQIGEVSDEHKIMALIDDRNSYRDEADKYFNTMNNLING